MAKPYNVLAIINHPELHIFSINQGVVVSPPALTALCPHTEEPKFEAALTTSCQTVYPNENVR